MNIQASSDFTFSDKEFDAIADIAQREFGLHLEKSKKQLVYSRLSKRLRSLGVSNFFDYLDHLSSTEGQAEKKAFISALTTNVTHFFREKHHFDMLHDTVFPSLKKRALSGERLRIWSAGCSAGQEPFSLAFTLLSAFPEAPKYDIKILATDIDEEILSRAVNAQYPMDQLSQIPPEMAKKFTTADDGNLSFSVRSEVRDLISFRQLNLIENWPIKGSFDVIMCRNVAIYFANITQQSIWERFVGALKPNGYLMIGHSERVSGPATNALETCGITTYRKR